MEVIEGSVECIVAIAEYGQRFVVAIYAGAQGSFEVGNGSAVDEVVEMLLRRTRRLEDSFDRRFAQHVERRVETREGCVDIVQQLLQPVSESM